jgi:hypothetical protein
LLDNPRQNLPGCLPISPIHGNNLTVQPLLRIPRKKSPPPNSVIYGRIVEQGGLSPSSVGETALQVWDTQFVILGIPEDHLAVMGIYSIAFLSLVEKSFLQHLSGQASASVRWHPNPRRFLSLPAPLECHSLESRILWSSWNLQWLSSIARAPFGVGAADLHVWPYYLYSLQSTRGVF